MQLGYLFGGQGGQVVGMGNDLYANEPAYRQVIDAASAVLGYDVLAKMNDKVALQTTKFTQPLVVAHSLGLLATVKDEAPAPTVALGLSLGEYTALIASGALTFEAGLELVAQRGLLMQAVVGHTAGNMAAVVTDDFATVEAALTQLQEQGEQVYPANYNSAQQLVIGGTPASLTVAIAALLELPTVSRVVPLNVAGAFHTPLLAAASEPFRRAIAGVEFHDCTFPVYSNTTEKIFERATIKETLVDQLTNPTYFAQDLQYLVADGVTELLEFGPDATLTKFARKTVKTTKRLSIFDANSLQKVRAAGLGVITEGVGNAN
ncbi:ACP S-malonyltransferase [Periweissella cryptocerci]|uniref:Malonyl CoA-acyl carrier protein transacylase n=1 Tax=Periweissella cryptocerci TaxID=2506420 RepID=A0A4P6YRC3_9LACO|nr:ACP S-malonyltransferase [Periweissella cryptocerci]QBO35161.1 ACP S-malonyltransferase [Periweissella cryptocerci]